jgi:PilZ domain-containing protein
MSSNRRKFPRKPITHKAKIVGNDGSWGRNCRVVDVSASGAKLMTDQPLKLPKEFMLALSGHGGPLRKCHLVWSNDNEIGVAFDTVHK